MEKTNKAFDALYRLADGAAGEVDLSCGEILECVGRVEDAIGKSRPSTTIRNMRAAIIDHKLIKLRRIAARDLDWSRSPGGTAHEPRHCISDWSPSRGSSKMGTSRT